MFLPLVLAALIGYFLGSLPFGWLIARRFGINIFEHGSKNPGATNVKRVLGEKFGAKGKRAGDLAFTLDALKGALAAGWPLYIYYEKMEQLAAFGATSVMQVPDAKMWMVASLTGLVFALLGHSFSCWTRFKGGKGVATTAGGLLVLLPLPTVLAVLTWLGAFYVSRYVSLASILAATVLPFAAWVIPGTPRSFAILATVVCSFVILRHRANIARLCNGTENKFGKKVG
jgi:acyl phosphate:glycerol-3-phosphate acyltransferase